MQVPSDFTQPPVRRQFTKDSAYRSCFGYVDAIDVTAAVGADESIANMRTKPTTLSSRMVGRERKDIPRPPKTGTSAGALCAGARRGWSPTASNRSTGAAWSLLLTPP